MKLDEWLNTPNPDGSRKVRRDFADAIRVTPQMISAYCNGTIPAKERMAAIARETGGQVTANDFFNLSEAAQ